MIDEFACGLWVRAGVIANATLKALESGGHSCAGFARSDVDVLDTPKLKAALKGASHVYLCVGLPYDGNVWLDKFPKMMGSVLEACEHVGARLVYFDNCYMYGPPPLQTPITEAHPQEPSSVKGRARKIATDLGHGCASPKVECKLRLRDAPISSAPARSTPLTTISFLDNMLDGHPPQTVMCRGPVHTYTYTEDAGRAMARTGH